jgi:large subunit ribosomal protein L21
VGDQIGAPFVAGAAVQASVIDQIKGEKVIHFVRRRRKHSSKRTKGHRQQLTLLRVTEILASGGEATGVKAAMGTGTKSPAAITAPAVEPAPSGLGKAAVIAGAAAAAVGLAAAAAATIAATRSGDSADQA